MRRILYITLAIAFIFSMCAVPVSAASYDLRTPQRLYYISRSPESFVYFSSYSIFSDENGDLSYNGGGVGFPYFTYIENDVRLWEIGTNTSNSSTAIYSPGFNSNSPFLWATSGSSVSNQLIFAAFAYEDLFLPSSGQYLKVTIRFTSFLDDIPSDYNYLINPSYFCYLCDDNTPGLGDPYSTPRLTPSSAAVSNLGNDFYEYSFYFNYDGIDPDLFDSENVCLAIRIPFYFSDSSIYSNGVKVYANCDLPTSYEILTIGGYNQEIESVENAIVKGFDDVDSILTDLDPEDTLILTDLEDKFDELDSTLNDYDDAMQPVFQMKDLYTHPPVANIIQTNTANLDTSEVKDFLSLPWIISAFSMIFAFCIIRLILFGTKEG